MRDIDRYSVAEEIDYSKLSHINNQIVEDYRLSDSAAMLFISLQMLQQSTCYTPNKNDLMRLRPNLTEYRYKKCMAELEELGYVEREEKRRGVNGRYMPGVTYKLKMPKPPRRKMVEPGADGVIQRFKNGSQNPRSIPKCENQLQAEENVQKPRNPRSGPECENQLQVSVEPRNPRSGPECDFRPQAGSPHKQTNTFSCSLDTPSSSKDSIPHVGVDGIDMEGKEGLEEGLFVCEAETGYARHRQAVEVGRRHVLEHCTEEECRELFDVVADRCTSSRYRDEQYLRCRPCIDSLMAGEGHWKEALVEQARLLADHERRRYPSMWFSDMAGRLRETVESVAPTWAVLDPVENDRKLAEVMSRVESRCR